MFIFVVNFGFVIQNVSFGIRCVITKITLEILLSLVHMSSLERNGIIFLETDSKSKLAGLKQYIVWSEMKDTDKWQCYDHFRPFFAICMFIFHKTEVQTVILRCLTGLNSDWFKNYDTKCKYFHFHFFVILYKIKHLCFLHFCILCHNFCTN